MKFDDVQERIARACALRHLSSEDFDVLQMAEYGAVVAPRRLAELARGLHRYDRPPPSVTAYELAVESLVRRNQLRALTESDCTAEQRRLLAWSGPRLAEDDWSPGAITFSADGFALFRELQLELFGPQHVPQSRSGWRVNDVTQQVEFATDSRDECARRMDEFFGENHEAYLGRPARILATGEVQECGAWLPSHFEVAERGWTAIVRFEWLPEVEGSSPA